MIQRSLDAIPIGRTGLDERQVGMIGFAFMLVLAVGAYSIGPMMKKRLSHMPVLGKVTSVTTGAAALKSPSELPVALAVPPEGVSTSSANNLESIEEIFLPSSKEEEKGTTPEALAASNAETAIRQGLSAISVDAVSNNGAFLAGRFYRYGEKLGIHFPGPGGTLLPAVLSGSDGSRVRISVGGNTYLIGGSR